MPMIFLGNSVIKRVLTENVDSGQWTFDHTSQKEIQLNFNIIYSINEKKNKP